MVILLQNSRLIHILHTAEVTYARVQAYLSAGLPWYKPSPAITWHHKEMIYFSSSNYQKTCAADYDLNDTHVKHDLR
jgi:hypothetical protein